LHWGGIVTTNNSEITKPVEPSQARKPYKAPELLHWGTMRDITLSAGTKSTHSDGAMKNPNKTS
jgi:hypothetical protein